MKILAVLALIVFGLFVHRHARLSLVIAFAVCIWCLALYGCASVPAPAPARTAPKSLTCGDLPGDGSYLLIGYVP